MIKKNKIQCAKCPTAACCPPIGATEIQPDKVPPFCPMKNDSEILDNALLEYQKPGLKEFARQASIQEFECYEHTPDGLRTKNPRIENWSSSPTRWLIKSWAWPSAQV